MRAQLSRLIHRIVWRIGGGPHRREWKSAKGSDLLARWTRTAPPIDVDIRANLPALRARSREEWQNDDHARHFGRLVKTNVVGPTGIRLRARVELASGQADAAANAAIEKAWAAWGKKRICDVTGVYGWNQLQRTFVETVARDGEALIRHVDGWADNPFRYAVQLIDPEMLDIGYHDTQASGNTVVMGVELNGHRRPVAYWLKAERRGPLGSMSDTSRTRVPADQVEHVYLPEWVFQTRGVPWISTSLTRLHNLTGYEEAEVIAARIGAAKMGFFETDVEADENLAGDGVTAAGAPVEDVRPGEIPMLPPGMRFTGWDPTHPTTAFGDFVNQTLRGVAAGFGVSYVTLSQDLAGVNFSSLRHGSLTERDLWMVLQDWHVESVCEPVYARWLRMALLSGAIKPRGGPAYGPGRLVDFSTPTWQPRRWPWVDPAKEQQADRDAFELRTKSLSRIIRDRGDDPDATWREIADDEARMIELGIKPPTAKGPAAPPGPPPPKPNPDDGDEPPADDEGDEPAADETEPET